MLYTPRKGRRNQFGGFIDKIFFGAFRFYNLNQISNYFLVHFS